MNQKKFHLLSRWPWAEGCSVKYYCGSLVFLLIVIKKVLKQETIALDVKAGYQWNVKSLTLMNHSDI